MVIVHDIYIWNQNVCFILGNLLNFALFWLIVKKSPKEMRFYSRILLQTAIVDILLVTITQLIHFTFFTYHNHALWYTNGLLTKTLPNTMVQIILASVWYQIYHMSIFGQAVQFFYRYLVLNRDIKISLARYLSMLLVIMLLTFVWFAFIGIEGYPTADDDKRIVEDQQLAELISGSSDHRRAMLTMNMDTTQPIFNVLNILYIMFNGISYAIIVFCAVKMIKFVRTNTMKSTQLELDKQLTRSMILLAIVPFLSMCYNILICASCVLINKLMPDNTQFALLVVSVQILSAIPNIWIAALNPLIVIIAIKPYRRTTIDFLVRAWARVTSQSPQNNVVEINARVVLS